MCIRDSYLPFKKHPTVVAAQYIHQYPRPFGCLNCVNSDITLPWIRHFRSISDSFCKSGGLSSCSIHRSLWRNICDNQRSSVCRFFTFETSLLHVSWRSFLRMVFPPKWHYLRTSEGHDLGWMLCCSIGSDIWSPPVGKLLRILRIFL